MQKVLTQVLLVPLPQGSRILDVVVVQLCSKQLTQTGRMLE
jgi:hypothetical protein